jgi:hypothetical protein
MKSDGMTSRDALLDFMGEMSEEYYSAGWLTGLEERLASWLKEPPPWVRFRHLERLDELRRAAGGWWVFDNTAPLYRDQWCRFVPDEESTVGT